MTMAAIGVSGVRWSGLFWRTLEPHRNKEYYRALRERLLEFVWRKTGDNGPACGRDAPFGPTNRPLRGIWHFAIQRTPDIVVFYTIDGGTLNLALWGSHHDYPCWPARSPALGATWLSDTACPARRRPGSLPQPRL